MSSGVGPTYSVGGTDGGAGPPGSGRAETIILPRQVPSAMCRGKSSAVSHPASVMLSLRLNFASLLPRDGKTETMIWGWGGGGGDKSA